MQLKRNMSDTQWKEIILFLKTMMFRKQPEGETWKYQWKKWFAVSFRGSEQADLWNILTQYMPYIVVLLQEVPFESDSIIGHGWTSESTGQVQRQTDTHSLQRQSLHLNPKETQSRHAILFAGEIPFKWAKLVAQMKSHHAVGQQQTVSKQTEE